MTLVIGAGATGVQVASIFNAFGSRVHLVEIAPRILMSEDHEVSEAVGGALAASGIHLVEDAGTIDRFECCATGVRLLHSSGSRRQSIDATLAVVAVGWVAATAGLALDRVGVQTDLRGYVEVDAQLRTSAPHVFAAGDVTGRAMVVYEAVRQALVAATNAVLGGHTVLPAQVSPIGSFTDPEYASTIAVRPAVRAVILTGAGHRAFSVGSDLRQRKDMTKEDWLQQRQDFDRTLYTVRQLRKPIFTAVNGIAYGGGCELAQSTDFIIASHNATFGQPEAMLGLAAGGGSPALLPRLFPPGKAMQMLMTGDPISAKEAYRLGMATELYDQDELMDAARRIAAKIAGNSPTAVQAVKQAVRMGQGEPIEQAIAIMMEAHWRSAVHPDRAEGIGAFNEDREPAFQDPDH